MGYGEEGGKKRGKWLGKEFDVVSLAYIATKKMFHMGVGHVVFSLHLGVGQSVLYQKKGVGHVFCFFFILHISKCSGPPHPILFDESLTKRGNIVMLRCSVYQFVRMT